MKAKYTVGDMHCQNCARRIEGVLKEVPGIAKAKANPQSKEVIVKSKEAIEKETVIEALAKAGYHAEAADES